MFFFFFLNDTATTEIYTLSLHDALPIWPHLALGSADRDRHRIPLAERDVQRDRVRRARPPGRRGGSGVRRPRSEEHTSELQSQSNLVCRLLLDKKKTSRHTPCCPTPTHA